VTILAFVVSIAAPLTIGWLSRSLNPADDIKAALRWIALGVFLVGLVVSFTLLYREPKRFFDRQFRPEIARACDR
jgi:hypothetical protein